METRPYYAVSEGLVDGEISLGDFQNAEDAMKAAEDAIKEAQEKQVKKETKFDFTLLCSHWPDFEIVKKGTITIQPKA